MVRLGSQQEADEATVKRVLSNLVRLNRMRCIRRIEHPIDRTGRLRANPFACPNRSETWEIVSPKEIERARRACNARVEVDGGARCGMTRSTTIRYEWDDDEFECRPGKLIVSDSYYAGACYRGRPL